MRRFHKHLAVEVDCEAPGPALVVMTVTLGAWNDPRQLRLFREPAVPLSLSLREALSKPCPTFEVEPFLFPQFIPHLSSERRS